MYLWNWRKDYKLKQLFQFIQRFPKSTIIFGIISALVLFNFLAYKQAYAMLHFTQQGQRTNNPEVLSTWQKVSTLLTGINIPKPLNDVTPTIYGLTYETHYIKVNDETELAAWYIPQPEAKGMVLLFHGYASSKSRLLAEAKAFNEMGYDTFVVDFRGSGGSNQSGTSIGFYEADDVAASVNYVQTKLGQKHFVLYGQSMGGVAILRAIAVKEVEPQGIIIEAIFDKMISTVENRFALMEIPSFPSAQVLIFWGSVISGYSGFEHNPVDYARNVKCPVLMLHGTADERATLEQAQAVYKFLQSEKRIELFQDVGHESYLVANPDQWRREVEQFLSQ